MESIAWLRHQSGDPNQLWQAAGQDLSPDRYEEKVIGCGTLALNLLRREKSEKRGVRVKRLKAALDEKNLLKALNLEHAIDL